MMQKGRGTILTRCSGLCLLLAPFLVLLLVCGAAHLLPFPSLSRFAINQSECRHATILAELNQSNLTSKENGECCDNCQATEVQDPQRSCATLLRALCEHPGVGRTTLIDTIAGLKTQPVSRTVQCLELAPPSPRQFGGSFWTSSWRRAW